MNNSLIVLQSEHTELLKCVRTTSTVLRDVAAVLRSRQVPDARAVALGKLRHVCRSLDALAGLSTSPTAGMGEGELEYDDEVHMDRALEGFSSGMEGGEFSGAQARSASVSGHDDMAGSGSCCFASSAGVCCPPPCVPLPTLRAALSGMQHVVTLTAAEAANVLDSVM